MQPAKCGWFQTHLRGVEGARRPVRAVATRYRFRRTYEVLKRHGERAGIRALLRFQTHLRGVEAILARVSREVGGDVSDAPTRC